MNPRSDSFNFQFYIKSVKEGKIPWDFFASLMKDLSKTLFSAQMLNEILLQELKSSLQNLSFEPIKKDLQIDNRNLEENDESSITEITKKTKHKCPHCPKSFSRAWNLTRHIATKHAKNVKLVDCPECDLKFKHSKELDIHIKQFHVVTDHQCPNCKKYLSIKSSLNRHTY